MNNSAWDNLTDTQKQELEREYNELQAWDAEQRKRREEDMKKQGKWSTGLDVNQKFFEDIIKERQKRFEALQKKYGFK